MSCFPQMSLKEISTVFSHRHDRIIVFCRSRLGFVPHNLELYRTAFTHKSYFNRKGADPAGKVNNERLEYLGDALLSAVVADYLYRRYPDKGEGFLTELRSKIVSRQSLNGVAKMLGLDELVLCDSQHPASHPKSIAGNTLEALVGAIYLDRGYAFVSKIITREFLGKFIDVSQLAVTDWNYKSKLYDYCQRARLPLEFQVVNTSYQGRDHRPCYEVEVVIAGEAQQSGKGSTIKEAEQQAAEATYKRMMEKSEF